MARATVVGAYEQLVVEGYLSSKRGSGTVVADVVAQPQAEDPRPHHVRPAIDLFPGQPDGSLFPRSMWLRAVRRVGREAPDDVFSYGDPRGEAALRNALAEYLGRSRSVAADEHGVRIFSGAVNSFIPLGRALVDAGVQRVGIEDPCFPLVRMPLVAAGLELVPVPVDDEGLSVDALQAAAVDAVLVAPAHQYPLGVTMSAARRTDLVTWARDYDGWIIEDDYDGEFRYDRQPIGSLQGLAPERVVYVGTASKMLSPALRTSWLVVPRALQPHLDRFSPAAEVPTLGQLALADVLQRGDVDRHLRHVRPLYERRQVELLDVLASASPWLTATGSAAGLHLTCYLDREFLTESDMCRRAAEHEIGLLGLGPHWIGPARSHGIVVGYSRSPQHRFAADLASFAEFLDSLER